MSVIKVHIIGKPLHKRATKKQTKRVTQKKLLEKRLYIQRVSYGRCTQKQNGRISTHFNI